MPFMFHDTGYWFYDDLPADEASDWRDLAMLTRDGPARIKPAPIPAAVEVTAKPSIAGLTCLAAMTHQLGSTFRF